MLIGLIVLDGLCDFDPIHARISEKINIKANADLLDHPDGFRLQFRIGHT